MDMRAQRRRRKMAMAVEMPHALRATNTVAMTAIMSLSDMGAGGASCGAEAENPASSISPANSTVTALPGIARTALKRIPIQFLRHLANSV
jgi:hypothetical protein